MEREQIESIIESLLFVAGEPLTVKRIGELIPEAKRKEVQAALMELCRRWEAPERGLRVVEVAGGWQFQTAPENAPWVGRLVQTRPVRLSRPAIETLAIVAYNQPVTRAEIEELRAVDSGGVLKTLCEHGFVKIVGRKDVPGKPLIYATDKKFMEFFRLKSLAELPTLREMEEIQEERIKAAEQQGRLPLELGDEPAGEDAPETAPEPGREPEDREEPGPESSE